MLLTAQANPQIFPRGAFECDTRIIIQVRGPGTITIAHDQGEAQSTIGDGLQFTQTTTAPPYDFVWQGEFWYKTDTPGQQFVLEIIGKVGGVTAKPGASLGQSEKSGA